VSIVSTRFSRTDVNKAMDCEHGSHTTRRGTLPRARRGIPGTPGTPQPPTFGNGVPAIRVGWWAVFVGAQACLARSTEVNTAMIVNTGRTPGVGARCRVPAGGFRGHHGHRSHRRLGMVSPQSVGGGKSGCRGGSRTARPGNTGTPFTDCTYGNEYGVPAFRWPCMRQPRACQR